MSEKHTAGLLKQARLMVQASDNSRICHTGSTRYGPTGQPLPDESEANARRIVAAWNACDGFSTKQLEETTLEELVKAYADTAAALNDYLSKYGSLEPHHNEHALSSLNRHLLSKLGESNG